MHYTSTCKFLFELYNIFHVEGELKSLESEDVHSSLHEAHEFMDLLNRNQQVPRLLIVSVCCAHFFCTPNGHIF